MRPAAVLAAAAAAALAAGPALGQTLGQAPDYGPSWWRVLLALTVCLVIALVAALVLRARMGGGRPNAAGKFKPAWLRPLLELSADGRRIRRLDAMRVGMNLEVCLFDCEGRRYLVAATPNSVVLLNAEPSTGEDSDQ